jgi:hypothetical protein
LKEFTPVDVFCHCCNEFLDRFDAEEDALDTGVTDTDTGEQTSIQSGPIFCETCAQYFLLKDKLDVTNTDEQELRAKTMIGLMRKSLGGDKVGYFLGIYSKEKIRNARKIGESIGWSKK